MANYGNPHRDARGRFTTAVASAATRRVGRLTQLSAEPDAEPDALCRYDTDINALTILHGGANLFLEFMVLARRLDAAAISQEIGP